MLCIFVAALVLVPVHALYIPSPQGRFKTSSLVTLTNDDFKYGTYRISATGTYQFNEDIEFEPSYTAGNMSWSLFPSDSVQYPQNGGYFLGFFAAITVEADNVVLDCQGYNISMSAAFHAKQRFYSHIELANMPFIEGQGPPQFKNALNTNSTLLSAKNVTIQNCNFGLSSHHSIHGNSNAGVTLRNLRMNNFEVAGISLNGASNVLIENVDAGPSLHQTFGASLSHATNMDHVINTLMPNDAVMDGLLSSTSIMLRGETFTVRQVFDQLRVATQEYVNYGTGALQSLVGNGTTLPDGSAVYGILLHRRGEATKNFGAILCPDDDDTDPLDKIAEQTVQNVHLKDIAIHDLKLDVHQVPAAVIRNKMAKGLGGDVFRLTEVWDTKDCYAYVGNPLSDAQIAMGVLLDAAVTNDVDAETRAFFFGSTTIPAIIQSWAAGNLSCNEVGDFVSTLWKGTAKSYIDCTGDAMAHFNKGTVGLRMGFQENVVIENLTISNLTNVGDEDGAPYCHEEDYQGMAVRAVKTSHLKNFTTCEVFQRGTFHSSYGGATNVVPFSLMRNDDFKAHFSHKCASKGMGDQSN